MSVLDRVLDLGRKKGRATEVVEAYEITHLEDGYDVSEFVQMQKAKEQYLERFRIGRKSNFTVGSDAKFTE